MYLTIKCIGDKAYSSLDGIGKWSMIHMPYLNVFETNNECFPSTIAFHDIDTVSVV